MNKLVSKLQTALEKVKAKEYKRLETKLNVLKKKIKPIENEIENIEYQMGFVEPPPKFKRMVR